MKAGLRQALIALALAATVAAVFLLEKQEEGVQLARPEAAPQAKGPAAAVAPNAQAVQRLSPEGEELFPVHSWRPPPPSASVEAPAPVAPPLPFEFKGRMEEGGQTRVFLARHEAMLVVKQGDILDGAYRVDAITPGSVEFTYLPLKLKQSLNFAK